MPGRVSIPRHTSTVASKKHYFREYLRENEIIFKNILGLESGAQVLFIPEKNRVRKSHATVPLSVPLVALFYWKKICGKTSYGISLK